MRIHTLALLAGLGLLAALPGQAAAATANGSFQVTMTIQDACAVQSATDLAFGSHSSLASAQNATSTISVQCSNSTPYTVALSGAGQLSNGSGGTIPYGLYRDSNHSQTWGSTASVNTQGGTGNGSAQSFTVYGRVPTAAQPAVGSYTDTVAITVTY